MIKTAANLSLMFSAVCLFGLSTVQAKDTSSTSRPLRPFYIIGHGANTLKLARNYISSGANALEMDVNLRAGYTNELCIGHGPDLGTGMAGKKAALLADYLTGLHKLAREHTNFCLVYFDCKTLASTPERGMNLLDDIRTNLVGSGADRIPMSVLISVGKLKDQAMFANIASQLRPREGLMVDGESNPFKVSKFFADSHVTNQAYADGIVPLHPFFTHFMVYGAVSKACRLRIQQHQIRFVGTWVVNNPWLMIRYINMGVDGIVVDRTFVWYNFSWANLGRGLHSLTHLVQKNGSYLGIRLANRGDDPFLSHE